MLPRPQDDVRESPAANKNSDARSLLRFITCGSVDDGKSTLLGRLLHDLEAVPEDQLATLATDSKRHGTTGAALDMALLVDGLEAEKAQGITIDVAYRFFSTDRRKFIAADTPGHEEYTRNMVTAASTADLAILLVDSTKGLLPQTRRHAFVASLLGVRHVVLAVNKIDIQGYEPAPFRAIVDDFAAICEHLSFATVQAIPISARAGVNLISRSEHTPWYEGPTLLEHLENVVIDRPYGERPFRFPVQMISRRDADFRGFAGTIASGSISVGDEIIVPRTGQQSRIASIVTYDGSLPEASEGQAVTLVLNDHIDVSRGDILADPVDRPRLSEQFQAHVIWFDAVALMAGRGYRLKTETDMVDCTITAIVHMIDIESYAPCLVTTIAMNQIAVCNIATQRPLTFDSYSANRATGNFILIDRATNKTVGAGMIDFPLRRALNLHWQSIDINAEARSSLKHHRSAVVWLTGFSGSGKSTIANQIERRLHAAGRHTYLLDGDNIRHGLNKDLGFTDEDRVENIRRIAEVARLMADAGLIVLVSFISPFASERAMARSLVREGSFVEVFVDTPLEECIRRDPKGLYKKALRGEIAHFTGISSPYERPESPEVYLNTLEAASAELADKVCDYLEANVICQ
ncbi:adenylylsulfate kinase /sulfate adenylyltransferase subunit 1 [Rhizobium sp. RU20A]|uniref:adenylyl-sulfate kinase n=1 Tax=Rhizobium sp. RU20A TaxID=1907412 RepID=UPI000953D427|nr:adenylyl-sulfate kinase [Rhizobium sp. RU20A]SIQ58650.1 adenylylsulfate kinase /sulfate adenylyltransferase subunit 1 [Rhizobium sp. RU20A]